VPVLNRLRDGGLVTSEWQAREGERARRYYSITRAGWQNLAAFRDDWAQFAGMVSQVLRNGVTERAETGAKGRPQ
jgi:PadR family transcriptional regulator PadR